MKPWSEIPYELIANRLEDCCQRRPDGNITWSGRWLDHCQLVLTAHSDFPVDIDNDGRRIIVWKALNDCARDGEINPFSIKSAINKNIKIFVRSKPIPFVYVTKLSVGWISKPISIRYRGASITITGLLPKKFDRSILDWHIRNGKVHCDPQKYAWVRVRINARSHNEAQARASDALDFLRGSINFGLNASKWTEINSDETRPLNHVLLGPCHTLHNLDGTIASEQFWYEPNFREFDAVRVDSKKWKTAFDFFPKMRTQIRRSNYGESLHRLIIRYCRTLDSGDPSSVHLHLWGILETVTGTVDDRYKVLIKRAGNLFQESELVRSTLQVMRTRRNRIVHAGVQEESRREDNVMLHLIAVTAIILAFKKSNTFTGFDEIGRFLALPNDKKALQRGLELHEEALEFHGF